MKNDNSYKTFFINYGLLVAIVIVMFGLLIYPIKVAQKSWQKNLKANVEFVLDEKEPNSWTVGNYIKINNPFALSAACYEVRNRKSGDTYKAIIIRIQTFYGPLPAVFTLDKDNNVEFIGYSSLHGKIAEQLLSNKTNRRISYWKSRIPSIVLTQQKQLTSSNN